jgi:tetratricopeptide (TPR) repeat protein
VAETPEEIRDVLREAEGLPYGPARSALVETALLRAEALDDPRLVFDVRTQLVECFTMGAEQAKAFPLFTACLADFDSGRIEVTDDDASTLRWQHKWVVSAMPKFPVISREQMVAALDDMLHRFLAAGQSPNAVYSLANYTYRNLEDREKAAEAYEQWITSPRDDNSNSKAGDASEHASYHLWLGNYATALEHAAPVIDGRLKAHKQPQETLADMLPAFMETGRFAEARQAHRRAYRLHRGDPHSGPYIARHLAFCARTGNEARGLEILSRHQRWFDEPTDPWTELRLAAASVLLLRRLEKSGLTVHRRAFGDRPAGPVRVEDLREELERRARALAAQFDARNGNNIRSENIEALMAAEPYAGKLQLSAVDTAPATDPESRAAAEVQLASTYYSAENWLDAAEALERARADFEKAGLAGTGEALRTLKMLAKCQKKLGEHADAGATRGELGERYREYGMLAMAGSWLEKAGKSLRKAHQPDAAAGRFAEAAECYERNGMPGKAIDALRGQIDALADARDYQRSHDIAVEAAARAEALPDGENRGWLVASTTYDIGFALWQLDRDTEATDVLDRAAKLYDTAGYSSAATETRALVRKISSSPR